MTGDVYHIPIQGRHNNHHHPHVVLLEVLDECIVVPGFGADGIEVGMMIQDFIATGFPADGVVVEMDNATHITFVNGWSGITAKWLVAKAKRMPKSLVRKYQHIGQMDLAGVRQVASGVVKASRATGTLAKKDIDRLQRLVGIS